MRHHGLGIDRSRCDTTIHMAATRHDPTIGQARRCRTVTQTEPMTILTAITSCCFLNLSCDDVALYAQRTRDEVIYFEFFLVL